MVASRCAADSACDKKERASATFRRSEAARCKHSTNDAVPSRGGGAPTQVPTGRTTRRRYSGGSPSGESLGAAAVADARVRTLAAIAVVCIRRTLSGDGPRASSSKLRTLRPTNDASVPACNRRACRMAPPVCARISAASIAPGGDVGGLDGRGGGRG